MFNENNIPVSNNDLIKLFFKEKPNKRQKHKVVFLTEEDFSLDFNKMVKFATSTDNQKKFTDFMRMIRKRVKDKKNLLRKNITESIDINNNSIDEIKEKTCSNFIDTELTKSFNRNYFQNSSNKLKVIEEEKKNEDDEVIYLPMSFNKILEHFNNKGKIRENIKKIKKTIVRDLFKKI